MDRFSKQDLNDLLEHQSRPKLSLYMPAIRAGEEIQQNPVRFKNLLNLAEERLSDHGLRGPDTKELLEPARERLLPDETFWQEQRDGLALFATPELLEYYRLPYPVEENVMVGDQFYVLPLFELINNDQRFYILALSQGEIRLLEGTDDQVEEVELDDMPTSLAEALRWDDPEKQTQHHTIGSGREGGDRGRPGITLHGQGVGRDDEKTNILRYFQIVDQGLKDYLKGGVPLVLAGVEFLFPIYREANSYNHLIEEGIPGNPEELREEELHAQALDLLEPLFEREQEEATELYRQETGRGSGRASDEMKTIIPAAYSGRVAHLFAKEGAEIWGKYELASNRVEVHPERTSGSDELINIAAVFTFKNGGKVYRMLADEMPQTTEIAANFRY